MVPILYGSQTGSSMHLAELLCARLGSRFFALPIDSFDIAKISEVSFVVFICSTHGDGQCPFNMAKFWNAITSDIPAVFKFRYAVLGLGDTNFVKYNWCAKMLYNRLRQLGATPVLKVLANTQDPGGFYDGYYRFRDALVEILSSEALSPDNGTADFLDGARLLDPSHGQEEQGASRQKSCGDSFEDSFEIPKKTYKATVVSNNLVTREGYQKQVREIVFDIPEYDGFYPGDCMGIVPCNMPDKLKQFNFTDAQMEFIRKNIDLNGIPHQTVFRALAEIAQDPAHREKLVEISNDYDFYHTYIVIPKRNITEILEDFRISPPFEFMATLGRIYPRYYSFSKIKNHYSVLVNMVDFKTYLATNRKGLCSEYLQGLNGTIDVEIVESRLFMEDKNLLFFATGTGLTLPRSVVSFFKEKNISIFYGFRSYENDLLCKEEFDGVNIKYAASVDDKRYIMDVYRKNKVENIDDWLVFVSGNWRLNKEIQKLLKEVHGKDVVFQSETW